jgi:hypothetical protein
MSYDLTLVKPDPGRDPLRYARAWSERDVGDAVTATAVQARQMCRLARVLLAACPDLELSGDPAPEESASLEVVELIEGDEGAVIIALFPDEAAVSIGYRQQDGRVDETVFDRLFGYLEVLRREAGYVAYDPQRDALVERRSDLVEALRIVEGVAARLDDITTHVERALGYRR